MSKNSATICIVMYGGGTTSLETARRAIEKYGHENTEIWFADTRIEDQDLYRFNRDVERLLGKKIRVFSQGLDVWDVFFQQRMLGNSRLDPCSKFLKRVPLRRALEQEYPFWKCTSCGVITQTMNEHIDIEDINNLQKKKGICNKCMEIDEPYREHVRNAMMTSTALIEKRAKLESMKEESGEFNEVIKKLVYQVSELVHQALDAWDVVDNRMSRVSRDGDSVVVALGMDNIEDCDRIKRARRYWEPFVVTFPLTEAPFTWKGRINRQLIDDGIRVPRLYDAGFKHNNCGGFCVKAGMGQFAHLYKVNPARYLMHERKEQEFREFIGRDVSILRRTENGVRINLTMQDLRERIEQGEEFAFDAGEACSCVNPPNPE